MEGIFDSTVTLPSINVGLKLVAVAAVVYFWRFVVDLPLLNINGEMYLFCDLLNHKSSTVCGHLINDHIINYLH